MIKPRPVAVGAFLLAALALLVGGILFFTAGTLTAKHLRTVSFFPGTVAGLQVGSTVTFLGVPVGQVTSLGVRVTQDVRRPIIQVEMELVPSRVAVYGLPRLRDDDDLVATLVQRGLAAQLIKESFITGRLGVELAFRTGVETSRVGGTDVPEVPTVPSDFAALAKQLQAVDIAGAVETFQHTAASLDALLNSPELRQTLHEAPAAVAQLRQTLATADREVAAFSRTGRGAVGDSAVALQKTLTSVQALVATLDRESTTTLTAMRGTLKRADGSLDDSPCAARSAGSDGLATAADGRRPGGDGGAPAQRRRAGRSRPLSARAREITMHRLSKLTIAGIALVLAACASSPPTLLALPSAHPSTATSGEHQASDAAATVRLRRVHVPDYLDGLPVVTGRDGDVLVVADRTEWAERPSQGVSRVLRDALAQRLGSSRVLIAGDGRRADADLSVELLALDPARGALTLDARWSFACRGNRTEPWRPHRGAGRDERSDARRQSPAPRAKRCRNSRTRWSPNFVATSILRHSRSTEPRPILDRSPTTSCIARLKFVLHLWRQP